MPNILWNNCRESSPKGCAAALMREISANSKTIKEKPTKPAPTAISTINGFGTRVGLESSAVSRGRVISKIFTEEDYGAHRHLQRDINPCPSFYKKYEIELVSTQNYYLDTNPFVPKAEIRESWFLSTSIGEQLYLLSRSYSKILQQTVNG